MTAKGKSLDRTDLKILRLLQTNARMAVKDIAEAINLTQSTTSGRIRRLEDSKVIMGYEARVDPEAFQCGLVCYIDISLHTDRSCNSVLSQLQSIPEIVEVHNVVGNSCLLVKAYLKDTKTLGHFLATKVRSISGVESTRCVIIIQSLKQTLMLPETYILDET